MVNFSGPQGRYEPFIVKPDAHCKDASSLMILNFKHTHRADGFNSAYATAQFHSSS